MDTKRVLWAGCLALLLWNCQGGWIVYGQQFVPVSDRGAVVAASASVPASGLISQQYVVETAHFRVMCQDAQFAKEVGAMAEAYRVHLAMHWLGRELRPWAEKVPLVVQTSPRLPASGETKYTLMGGDIRSIHMTVSGTKERILDSVLPHEMTHTVLATHFAPSGKPVPRWADEGACTTVEHISERSKHDVMLVKFLTDGRGIPFSQLFAMREYPSPPYLMPLYAQSYSLCAFLIAQGGPRRFVQFLEMGMQTDNWAQAVADSYGYAGLGRLKVAWNAWVSDGGGDVARYTAASLGGAASNNPSIAAPGSGDIASVQPSGNSVQGIAATDGAATMLAVTGSSGATQGVAAGSPQGESAVSSAKTPGFYQRQLQMHQGTRVPISELQAPIQVRAGQPSSMQSIGGPLVR